jgi:O-phosphoseryl-tRNA(Cys) synthetase
MDCKCNTGCCGSIGQNQVGEKSKIIIDLLYLDLNICNRCQGTDEGLEEAIADVTKVLESVGVEIIVNKIHINSKEKAIQYRFVTSPTIRVNGRDIQMEFKESLCESCGDLCGDEVDCRVWVYKGKEYNIPPKAMIIDAILREVYGNTEKKSNDEVNKKSYQLPENLRRFFESI